MTPSRGREAGRTLAAGEAGMTLIEMLIVLAITAIAAGAVALGIGATTRAPTAESEARRLAGRIQAAADDAMIGDRMQALTFDARGYGFSAWNGTSWVPREGESFGYHPIPGGMTVEMSTQPPVLLVGDGAGMPLVATVKTGAQRWQVRFDGLTAVAVRGPAA